MRICKKDESEKRKRPDTVGKSFGFTVGAVCETFWDIYSGSAIQHILSICFEETSLNAFGRKTSVREGISSVDDFKPVSLSSTTCITSRSE